MRPLDRNQARLIERNMRLAVQQAHNTIVGLSPLDEIPDGATVVLIPDDDPTLAEFNREVAHQMSIAGRDVRHIHVQSRRARNAARRLGSE